MNAEQNCLHKDPAFPQGLPTWKAIARASEKAAKTSDRATKSADRLRDLVSLIQQGHDLHDFLGHYLSGRQIRRKLRELSQFTSGPILLSLRSSRRR